MARNHRKSSSNQTRLVCCGFFLFFSTFFLPPFFFLFDCVFTTNGRLGQLSSINQDVSRGNESEIHITGHNPDKMGGLISTNNKLEICCSIKRKTCSIIVQTRKRWCRADVSIDRNVLWLDFFPWSHTFRPLGRRRIESTFFLNFQTNKKWIWRSVNSYIMCIGPRVSSLSIYRMAVFLCFTTSP